MFKSHPSILKIKDRVQGKNKFSFCGVNEEAFSDEISRLDISKPTTFNNIPAKILTDTKDICSSHLSIIFNNSLSKQYFPSRLKNG